MLFIGTLVDAGQRRIAVKSLDIQFFRIAVVAVNAHSFDRILKRGFAGEILRHASFHVAPLTAVKRRRSVEHQKTRGASPRRHFTQLELDRLMLADRLAKGLAGLRVVGRQLQRTFGDADTSRGDVDATELKTARCLIEALPFDPTNQVVDGNAVVFESKLRGIDRFIAELFQLAADSESLLLGRDEQAHALVTRLSLRISFDEQREA